jgi:hypothetical protein
MKTQLLFLTLLFAGFASMNAQTTMNIYQSNGTVLQIPISSIDSITYTINNPGNLATITTLPIGNTTSTSATSGGSISATGGSSVTQRGLCWSTSQNPTTANSSTNDGSGTGSFTSNLTGLTANTTYYVRAYAINSAGTAYGNQQSFSTTASTNLGSISFLGCNSPNTFGTLKINQLANIFCYLDYFGGNGLQYNEININSYGVEGLTANLASGNFSVGDGTLTLNIIGTPNSTGTASFDLSIGGYSCTLNLNVCDSNYNGPDCLIENRELFYGTYLATSNCLIGSQWTVNITAGANNNEINIDNLLETNSPYTAVVLSENNIILNPSTIDPGVILQSGSGSSNGTGNILTIQCSYYDINEGDLFCIITLVKQ